MVALVSRTGRHLQRYRNGHRQVVGCIPYRYKVKGQASKEEEKKLEVLMISSQKQGKKGMMFPKGGWETDESIKQAAERETEEEAGVLGIVEQQLGKWHFKSRSQDSYYEGYMFPLLVVKERDSWPEKHLRQRKWMSVRAAKEACQHWWMKEALDELVGRLAKQNKEAEVVTLPCPRSLRCQSNL
ncbi:nudix hydrolase 18, mitochondrial-like [Diospyros lotus]|uniref:nudix hydrolase 18, mitochondrial-like n=1 Tax=Diospyros lotus TaxID=55363 RepID=UPI00225C116D|nr:nudix hydrolase 18, mitochondrial-like [Diospyros lotus]